MQMTESVFRDCDKSKLKFPKAELDSLGKNDIFLIDAVGIISYL